MPVYIQDSPNTVTGITVPSSKVTTWIDDTFSSERKNMATIINTTAAIPLIRAKSSR